MAVKQAFAIVVDPSALLLTFYLFIYLFIMHRGPLVCSRDHVTSYAITVRDPSN